VSVTSTFAGTPREFNARLPTPAMTPSALGGESPFMTWGDIEGVCVSLCVYVCVIVCVLLEVVSLFLILAEMKGVCT
jgi:hypothetical protein